MTENEPLQLRIARLDIGLREIKGAMHAPRIVQMLQRVGAWWRDDETPWCGVAVADWMLSAGHKPPQHYYRALAWASWGIPQEFPSQGSVAVLKRDKGGHVGLVTGFTSDRKHVRLLGGNQGDAVNESWFPVDRVVAWRRPAGEYEPIHVQMAKIGALSTSEA